MAKTLRVTCSGADLVDFEDLRDFQLNLKDLSEVNYRKLRNLMEKHGFSFPFFVWKDGDTYHTMDGHQRLRVLRKMREEGWQIPPLPVAWIEAKDEREARQKLLAAASQFGTVNEQGLYEFVQTFELDIKDVIHDFSFPEIDLDEFLESHTEVPGGQGDPDVVPEPPKKAKSRRGDLFILGNHRLLCGDSTKEEDVTRLMDGQKAQMCFCDPPYGVSYQKKNQMLNSLQPSFGRLETEIHGDDLSIDELKELVLKIFRNIYLNLDEKSSYYITAPQGGELGLMMMMMQEAGIPCRHMIVWVKNNAAFSMNRLDYDYRHEPILYGWSKDKTHNFYGKGDHKNSVWEIDRENNKLHPTMKPTVIIENALLNSTLPNEIVIDYCGGSGSTLIACEKLKRHCLTMEIDMAYCDVIIQRWREFSGQEAYRLESDGTRIAWSDILLERHHPDCLHVHPGGSTELICIDECPLKKASSA